MIIASWLICINGNLGLAALRDTRAVHTGSIEAPGQLAVRRQRDDAAIPMNRWQLAVDDIVGCRLDGHMVVLDECADLTGDGEPDEILASPGGRHGAGGVRRVRTGADDGRIADAAVELGLDTARRCSRGDIAFKVECNYADRAVFVSV